MRVYIMDTFESVIDLCTRDVRENKTGKLWTSNDVR